MNEALVTFIRGIQPVSIFEAAGELATLGEYGAAWPRATAEHWRRELDSLCKAGILKMDAKGMLTVSVSKKPSQMELF